MNRNDHLLLIFCLAIVYTSCNNSQIKKEAEWRLGWRMINNYSHENFETSDLQFDSLFSINNNPDLKFLEFGLKLKSKLNKVEELNEIISIQSESVIIELCNRDWVSDIINCKNKNKAIVDNTALQKELLIMFINDQAARGNLMKDIIEKYEIDTNQISNNDPNYIDNYNISRLKEIILEYGFPTGKLIGKDAMNGVFFIIQHSNELDWQKANFPKIKSVVSNGYLDGQKYAMLYDRIQKNSGLKQKYGTQLEKIDETTYRFYDLENEHELDRRRMEIGLFPFSMYKQLYKEEYDINILE
jgi:hypothetical protein